MIGNAIDRKAIMYATIRAIESDFIQTFATLLTLDDIPKAVLDRSNRVTTEQNILLSYLMGLDIQSYIEICQNNIDKLSITLQQQRFLHVELIKAIPIRNRVMHPRPIEMTDYPVLKEIAQNIVTIFPQFIWAELKRTLSIIEEDPSQLQLPPIFVQKSSSIIENLPAVSDFEETTFIGRRKEIGGKRQIFHRLAPILKPCENTPKIQST